ncbi:pyridoxamine kinase [candidate division KSB3 bacterium]|uniref:pyridoxal kinase n=1 Tax=candidate division KSB3 bacterium TaxID=2044937 RepID=A0A2G6E7E3_9BACT|nr:MAG: pyridoxamine kinase [candidate division KSB3 bacterium]PIE30377.1 MAG: pyridoxamine kinase [candidate division KSB3 bacterium]
MQHTPVPKIAAIHDLACFGRAALSVVMPILSSMGIQVCPLPTAIFSTHGGFPGYRSLDITAHINAIIAHWKVLQIEFDAIYSGFLSSPAQIDIFSEFILDFSRKDQLIVIDPVLGDHGKLYGVTAQDMLPRMKDYIRLAHLITPNLTEAALLLDEPYSPTISDNTLEEWLIRLTEFGPGRAVVTSVPSSHAPKSRTCVAAYERETQRFWKICSERVNADFPGSGDTFTSVIVGSLVHGEPLECALQRSIDFIERGITYSSQQKTPEREGILVEKFLASLTAR